MITEKFLKIGETASEDDIVFFQKNRDMCVFMECSDIKDPDEIASSYNLAKPLGLNLTLPITIEGKGNKLFKQALSLAKILLFDGYIGIVIVKKSKRGIACIIIKVEAAKDLYDINIDSNNYKYYKKFLKDYD